MYNPQLETFLTVADAGSFHKAAEELFISPPAVIKQINQLEAQLNVTLFVRTHRGLALTEAGKSLYQDARYVIRYCKESVERAKAAMQSREGVIRIGTSPMTPAQSMVDLWPRLQAGCPDLKFQVVPFENTPENAREILRNFGRNIDVIAGIFDDRLLDYRQCAGMELCRVPLCCAVSVNHRLARQEYLRVQDLYGENLLMMHRGWSHSVDLLRDDLQLHHPEIHLVDFDFYNLDIFNRCENSNDVLIAIENWKPVHPLLKILPVAWDYTIPFGILHAPEPSEAVRQFLQAVSAVMRDM
ncbi:MAG: LysR family transcriptional regulator [Peptococcaceae bacterium]